MTLGADEGDDWFRFAHGFNGYEEAGSLEACASISSTVKERLGSGEDVSGIDTFDLRCALFFMARAFRHSGGIGGEPPCACQIMAELQRRGIGEGRNG